VVLLHAFPLTAHMWQPQLELAGQGWHVIAPHLRGFAAIDEPPAVSMDDYAGTIVDLLDALHIHQAVIGGLSLGGYVAFALLRLAPRYLQGLVLADTKSEADTPEGRDARVRMLELLRERGVSGVVENMMPKLLSASTPRQRPEIVERVRGLALSNSTEAIAGAIRAMMARPDSTPLLTKIGCPTLVLVGEEDTLTPPSLSEQMARTIPGAEYEKLPGAGHLSNLEQPSAFNRALAHFLEHRI